MKTAEEWADKYRATSGRVSEGWMKLFLEQVQLDAWKQGMTDALEFCHDDTEHREHIEQTRDNKKEL